jgi:hypothetical protein
VKQWGWTLSLRLGLYEPLASTPLIWHLQHTLDNFHWRCLKVINNPTYVGHHINTCKVCRGCLNLVLQSWDMKSKVKFWWLPMYEIKFGLVLFHYLIQVQIIEGWQLELIIYTSKRGEKIGQIIGYLLIINYSWSWFMQGKTHSNCQLPTCECIFKTTNCFSNEFE